MKLTSMLIAVLFLFVCRNSETPAQGKAQQKPEEQSVSSQHQWSQIVDHAGFPGSYNFSMFAINDELWVFHPQGVWHSADGKEWIKSPLPNILNDGFLDYVQFKGAIYALGTFDGNIEHFTQTAKISKTTDLKKWEVVAERSNIPQRYFFASVVYDNKIWMMGGEYRGTKFNDVWNSDDAIHWTQVNKNAVWNSVGGGAIVFKGKILLLTGDLKTPVKVYSTTDGKRWDVETDAVSPIPFFGAKAIVFDSTIWLLGCNRNGEFTNEIVYSKDGKHWFPEHAPWSPRGGAAAAILQNKLFMTGGKYSTGSGANIRFIYSNDVWSLEKK